MRLHHFKDGRSQAMRVTEVMKHPVRTVTPDQPVGEAAEVMSQYQIEHLVVLDGGAVAGMLSASDCAGVNPYIRVRDVMSMKPVTIESDELISRAANLMRGHRIHSIIVTKNRKLAGIVTTSDLLEIIGRSAGHTERPILRDGRSARRNVSPAPI
jgi:CBS domain-containing protein